MNDSRELAQKIIDKYITILGILPVYLLLQDIPNIKLNSKGKVLGIRDDKNTLLKLINAIEPYTGKFIKRNVLAKYMADYESGKEIT
ncbi:hypothetical protein EBU91_01120 [bacterium]|jgi:hypothetical protein|nr:hypothetical protein [bacterium]